MSAQTAAERGRRARTRLGMWPSRADVYRKFGETEQQGDEPVTNEYAVALTDVPVRITGSVRSREIGPDGSQREEGAREAHFLVGTDIYDGDVILLTAGECEGDLWHLKDVARTDQKTSLRVQIEAADPSVLEG